MKLYLDMDGVLMDYASHTRVWGCDWRGELYHHKPESEWTEEQATYDRRYKDAMAEPDFWRTMPTMPDAAALWGWCAEFKPHVLTATPTGATYRDRCVLDKFHSIRRWFDPLFPYERFHAVQRSEKVKFALTTGVRNAILVDDMLPNCEEWTAAGGTAILHVNAVDTIRKLQELIHV